MTEIEILKEKLEKIEAECKKVWEEYMDMATRDVPYMKALNWYNSQSCIAERESLEQRIRLLENEYNLEPIPDYGDHMTIEKFIDYCNSGMFIDSDGSGYYATKDQQSNIPIYPSDVKARKYRKDFSHVVWFNK